MSKTINYSAGVQGRELGWSVPFLLDDAGLNKGPPTNTNTGSWLLSFTNFFRVFVPAEICKHAPHPKTIWQSPLVENNRGEEIYTSVTERPC